MRRTILVALLAGAVCAPAAAQEMEPGEWRFDSTASSPLFPQPQTGSVTTCVKAEDATDPSRWASKPDPHCTTSGGKRSGDSYTWEFSCPKSNMKGNGSVRYGKGSVESDVQMTGEMQGQKFEIRTHTKGTRLGPCRS